MKFLIVIGFAIIPLEFKLSMILNIFLWPGSKNLSEFIRLDTSSSISLLTRIEPINACSASKFDGNFFLIINC